MSIRPGLRCNNKLHTGNKEAQSETAVLFIKLHQVHALLFQGQGGGQ